MFYLVATKDNQEVFVFPLHEGVNTIGRRSSNQIVLSDKSVSRIHACLLIENDRLQISDLSSANGTHYRGELINEPKDIDCNKKFYIGRYKLSVVRSEEIDWKRWRERVILRVMGEDTPFVRLDDLDVLVPGLMNAQYEDIENYTEQESKTDTFLTPITLMDDIYEERYFPNIALPMTEQQAENEGIEAIWNFMESLMPEKMNARE